MRWRSAAARRIKELTGKVTVDAAVAEIARRLVDGQPLPPTDLNAILPRVGIRACYADIELRSAGELRKAEDGFEIAYCPSDSYVRRRFTIAHEIAHAIFERTGPHCPRSGRELERICDMIAAEILVPRVSIAGLDVRTLNIERLSGLAKRYETSLTSMAIRCAKCLGLMIAQSEYGEVTWYICPSATGMIRPLAQIRKLTARSEGKHSGELRCAIEYRSFVATKTMEWTTVGSMDRRLFIFRDAESTLREALRKQPSQLLVQA